MNNFIYEYYQKIKSEEIVVGEYIKAVFEYIMKGLEEKAFYFDSKKANKAIKFIENFCHHTEGRNDLLKLELWQKAIVSCIFGLVDNKGLRQFREVVIVMARKNGKTLFASAIIAYHAFLDPEYGKKVFCLAPKLEQADLVFNSFRSTTFQEPELEQLAKSRKSDIYIESTETSIKKIAFNAKKADGFNPSLVICDEIASWRGDAGLKQYEVMKSGQGARKEPLIISISTSGYENDGIYDELMKRSTRMLDGGSGEKRLLPFLYMIDDVEKWNDINELRKSNPNLGVSVNASYLIDEAIVAEQSLSKKAEFMCKYCNIKQNSSVAWLKSTDIANASGHGIYLEDFKGSYCVGGIDLSQTTDLTACTAVIEKGGELYCFAQFFLPANMIDEATERDGLPYYKYIAKGILKPSGENFIDYKDCFDWFRELVERYEIYPLKVGYDRYSAQYLVNDMKGFGFHMDDVYQGDNLYPVLKEFEGLLKDGKIHIGDNDLLKVHLLNSALKMNIERGRGRLVKINAMDHIDGMAALSDAFCVRQKYYDSIGEQLKN